MTFGWGSVISPTPFSNNSLFMFSLLLCFFGGLFFCVVRVWGGYARWEGLSEEIIETRGTEQRVWDLALQRLSSDKEMLSPGVMEVESVASKGRVTEQRSNMCREVWWEQAELPRQSWGKERTAGRYFFLEILPVSETTGIEPRTGFGAATKPGNWGYQLRKWLCEIICYCSAHRLGRSGRKWWWSWGGGPPQAKMNGNGSQQRYVSTFKIQIKSPGASSAPGNGPKRVEPRTSGRCTDTGKSRWRGMGRGRCREGGGGGVDY